MFELLFRYAPGIYARGHLVLLGSWPVWRLGVLILISAAGLGWLLRGRWNRRHAGVWALQTAMVALLLLLLWQPALSLAELQPRQNIIAVLVDDSHSMAQTDGGAKSREAAAQAALQASLLPGLEQRFQTRLYSMDRGATRLASPAQLRPDATSTRIGDSLRQVLDDTADLPLGAIVVLSDGADTSGGPGAAGSGIDRDTIAALRARRVPVHTVGFGAATPARDAALDDVQMETRALTKSRVPALVSFHQHGFAGQRTQLTLRAGSQLLASQNVTFGPDDVIQTAQLMFNAGDAGLKTLQFALAPVAGETNPANNNIPRLLNVRSDPKPVLYIEGEPRWEYKFIRRAESFDPQVQLVSMVRATENKIYRQGISDPSELAGGFPSRAEDLFRYQALIIGSVEAAYFSPVQQDLITQFADRRGGGILFLGGDASLADGGWGDSSMAPLLPVTLPAHKGTFVRADLSRQAIDQPRGQAYTALAPAGGDSIITRLVDDPAANAKKWHTLPWLMDYQDAGVPKPGAAVLANVLVNGRTLPLLTTESYGRGRTAVLATSGTWRWQMMLPYGDPSHDLFWQQLVRWLAAGSPGQLTAAVPQPILYDQSQVHLSVELRDSQYLPAANQAVAARVLEPNGQSLRVPLRPSPSAPGQFSADFTAAQPGVYLADVSAAGGAHDAVAFQRLDGVAESFHSGLDADLLQRLADQTGGSYWRPDQLAQLERQIPYSNAGITLRDNLPLWNLPIVFLLLLALPIAEWFLRRKWGVV